MVVLIVTVYVHFLMVINPKSGSGAFGPLGLRSVAHWGQWMEVCITSMEICCSSIYPEVLHCLEIIHW